MGGIVACANLEIVDKIMYGNTTTSRLGYPLKCHNMHWPWGAGMFATSLGPDDACFVAGANWEKGSGYCVTWGSLSAVQKEIIEASKTDECANGIIGRRARCGAISQHPISLVIRGFLISIVTIVSS